MKHQRKKEMMNAKIDNSTSTMRWRREREGEMNIPYKAGKEEWWCRDKEGGGRMK